MVGGHGRLPRHRGRAGRPLRLPGDPARAVRPVGAAGTGGFAGRHDGLRRDRPGCRRPVGRRGGGAVRAHRRLGQQRRRARARSAPWPTPTRPPWNATWPPTCSGVIHGSATFARHVRSRPGGGSLVNLSSGAATDAYRGWAAYCASKAAVEMLTEVVGLEEPTHGLLGLRRRPRRGRHRHAGPHPVHPRGPLPRGGALPPAPRRRGAPHPGVGGGVHPGTRASTRPPVARPEAGAGAVRFRVPDPSGGSGRVGRTGERRWRPSAGVRGAVVVVLCRGRRAARDRPAPSRAVGG